MLVVRLIDMSNITVISRRNNGEALYRAVREDNLKEVRRLLALNNADANYVNSQSWTPLLHASYYGKEEIVEELVHAGANIDFQLPSGWTSLYLAAQNGHRRIVEFLCLRRADVNKPCTQGFAPLHAAARNGHSDCIESLVAFDADIERLSNIRSTPLMAAVYLNHPGAVSCFLRLNADTSKFSVHGYNVSDTANVEIQNILERHKQSSVAASDVANSISRIKRRVEHNVFGRFHAIILDVCIALSAAQLPAYVLLWIMDFLPSFNFVSHLKKIRLIESIVNGSIRRIQGLFELF